MAFGRGGLEQPPRHRHEPRAGYLAGLIQHDGPDVSVVAVALPDQVGQPSRAGYDDTGAVARRGHLRPLRVPPKMAATASPTAPASGDRAAWAWVAGSRVGTSTRPRGRHAIVCPGRWRPAGGHAHGLSGRQS
jgi:hypothetical protein